MAMSVLDAMRQVVKSYPGRVEAMAQRMGKNPATLRHEVSGAPGYKLGAEDLGEMTNFAQEAKQDNALLALSRLAENCGQMLVPLPLANPVVDDDCMLRLADSAREFGELCKEVAGDLADGKITNNELARIDRECGELIASVYAMREAVARRNAELQPRGV
jgi:hypothetical protein